MLSDGGFEEIDVIKPKAAALVALSLVWGSPSLAQECWVCSDSDGDQACDFQDNCVLDLNGPLEPPSQYDADLDGFGNACDPDYDNNGATTTTDFQIFFSSFTGIAPTPVTDHDGNGVTTTTDFDTFLAFFASANAAPGPSGFPCAGLSVPCLAPPDPPGEMCE